MTASQKDDLLARLQLALGDIAKLPHGDLVRNMAETVAISALQELLFHYGLAALADYEQAIDLRHRRALCRLVLAYIGRSVDGSETSHRLLVMPITVVNRGHPVQVLSSDWQPFGVTLQRCVENEVDQSAVSVSLEWDAVPIEHCQLSSATGALAASSRFKHNPPPPPATLSVGKTRVLFAARLRGRAPYSHAPHEEWALKALRIQRQLRFELVAAQERFEELDAGLTVITAKAMELENVPTALLMQDVREHSPRRPHNWRVEGDTLVLDGHRLPLSDSSIDLETLHEMMGAMNQASPSLFGGREP